MMEAEVLVDSTRVEPPKRTEEDDLYERLQKLNQQL